jgi:hypothetical protein
MTTQNPDLSPPGTPLVGTIETTTRRFIPSADNADLMPTMVTDVKTALKRLEELREFIAQVMVEDSDYGKLPGMKQYTLYKPGAEKLLECYGYAAELECTERIERWDTANPFFAYEYRVTVISKRTGNPVGQGVGSCNSMEAKYRWRDATFSCPKCSQPALIRGKPEYGRGQFKGKKHWVCLTKKQGCGELFPIDMPEIAGQLDKVKVPNDDVYTLVNTILKMAKKRALVDAALSVTRSSDLFIPEEDEDDTPGRGPKTTERTEPKRRTDGRIEVEIGGRTYATLGVGAETLAKVWTACKAYDKAHVAGEHKKLLAQYAPTSKDTMDLTEEQGVGFLKILDEATNGKPPPSGPMETLPGEEPPFGQ